MQHIKKRLPLHVQLTQPEMYLAASVSDFVKNKADIIPTGFSLFTPRSWYKGTAAVSIIARTRFTAGNDLHGFVSDYAGTDAPLEVLLSGRYQLDGEKKALLSDGKILYKTILVYRPHDNRVWLANYGTHGAPRKAPSTDPVLMPIEGFA